MLSTITPTTWEHHQADLINIRTAVFMQEQQVSAADEWDGLDEQAIHFLALSTHGDAYLSNQLPIIMKKIRSTISAALPSSRIFASKV